MRPVITEQTSTSWKAPQAIGSVIMVLTLLPMFFGFARPAVCLLPLLAGVGLYTIGRVGAWWNHG